MRRAIPRLTSHCRRLTRSQCWIFPAEAMTAYIPWDSRIWERRATPLMFLRTTNMRPLFIRMRSERICRTELLPGSPEDSSISRRLMKETPENGAITQMRARYPSPPQTELRPRRFAWLKQMLLTDFLKGKQFCSAVGPSRYTKLRTAV